MAKKKPPGNKQKQLPVSLTPYLRRNLETAAARSGVSLGEVVRRRLFQSFADDTVDSRTRELGKSVIGFAVDVKLETGHEWFSHAAANRALWSAVGARLMRLKPDGEEKFSAEELPANRIITSSEDPRSIGITIEAFDFKHANNERAKAELSERFRKSSIATPICERTMNMSKRGHGEGTIEERGNDVYRLRYRVDGNRFTKTFRGTLTEARKELRRLVRSGDTGEHVAPDKITVAQWIDQWIAAGAPGRKKERVGQRSLERYEELLNVHVKPVIGNRRIQQLQPHEIDKLYSDMAEAATIAPRT